jgi:3-deoxy-7-phosphoheptulonate synthase
LTSLTDPQTPVLTSRSEEPWRHTNYPLASRKNRQDSTIVEVGDVRFGGTEIVLIAGPCAVESREQIVLAAEIAKSCGATMLRGGAFKMRTSPYSFQGLGFEAIDYLVEARRETGLPFVTEVVDEESVLIATSSADMLQIGSRNMQNFVLLRHAARSGKPVLLKRGFAATLDELMHAAEYILAEGNPNIVLCERGVRGFSDFSRNTLDLNIIPAVKKISHLPIITDPSHGTGNRDMVLPLARASIAAGADGVIVEMHPDPERALSDGFQSLYPEQLEMLSESLKLIAPIVGRTLTVHPR